MAISAAYSPPPPEDFTCPVSGRVADHVRGGFVNSGVAEESISFTRDGFTFNTLIPYSLG